VRYDEFLQNHIHLVVKMQAWARGNRVRKNVANFKSDNRNTQFARYLTHGENDPAKMNWDESEQSEEEDFSQCAELPETKLPDKSKYTGQWKDHEKHGKGE